MDDAEVTKAVCRVLAERTGWRWALDGLNPTAAAWLFYGPIGASPDEAIGVTVYGGTDDLVDGLMTRRVQLMHRGKKNDPAGADTLAGVSFVALHGLSRTAGINTAFRRSWARLGPDGNGRQERSDNYQIILDNTEA